MAKRAPDIFVKTLVLAGWAGIIAAWGPRPAAAQSDQASRKAAIEARLKPTRANVERLRIAPGDTIFLETSIRVPSDRVAGGRLDYEGLVNGIVTPEGIVVHPRVHSFELRRLGAETEVRFLYPIHVEPGTLAGGKVRLTVSLVRRQGLANIVAKQDLDHTIRLGRSNPSPPDIAADFYGYRYYRRLALRRRKALRRVGLQLSLKDQERLPPLDRAPAKVAAQVLRYDQERRLFWVAQRHLVAAMQHPDPKTRQLAQAYLQNLDRPRREWQGVPTIELAPASTPPPVAAAPPPPRARQRATRLEPDSERPFDSDRARRSPDPDRPQRLRPSTEYEVGTERPAPPPPARPPPERIPEEPPSAPEQPQVADEDDNVIYEEDPFGQRTLRRLTKIPSYYRGLVFEDPNIAHGGAVRTVFASIETREAADTIAVFYSAQAAITRYLGAEITVPTQYLDITSFPGDRDPPAQYEFGNPLVALKYRIHLPKVGERYPAVTFKARWGIPFARLHSVPATELDIEEFTREVHFVDTYAFFLENHSVGIGANVAWQWRWLYAGVQLFGDVFIPVDGTTQSRTFSAISYGASVGALPFGDYVAFFVEGRGSSLLLGGGRNEFFTYLGARGQLLDMIEPAVWIGLPLGSIREASPIQFGLELRFSYDVVDVVEPRRRSRSQDILE